MGINNSFLEAEVRNGYLVTKQMKEIWSVQLRMVEKLLEVCNKYGLKIWADSGTLLGCVRDKGYIPWDDDIDMIMMRDDYNKLIKIGNQEFKAPYFLQSAHSEKVPYPRGHAQLRMDGTTMILPYDIHQKFHQGIFIDIFVYDAIPQNKKELNIFLRELYLSRNNVFRWYSFLKVTKEPLKMACDLFYKNTHDFYDVFLEYENLMSKYKIEEDSYLVSLGFMCTTDFVNKTKLPAYLYAETEYLPFENINMPVPKGYHEVLTILYGDYMTPVQAPTCHGGFSAIDTKKSYVEYIPKLKKEEQKRRWLKLLNIKKLLR